MEIALFVLAYMFLQQFEDMRDRVDSLEQSEDQDW